MSEGRLRIAVIGTGGYALAQIKAILDAPESARLSAVTARKLNSAGAEFCRQKNVPVFESVEQLLDYGEFDAVLNPTPIHLHESISEQCLRAGFPVFLEKPPTATVQELDRLSRVTEETGLPVAICFNWLYSPVVRELKARLVSGEFGRIQRVKGIGAWIRTKKYFSRNPWAGKVCKGEHWVLDGTINNPFAHVVCNNLFFAAPEQYALAEPETVTAELYHANSIESEDTSCMRIRTTDGIEIMNWLTLTAEDEIPPTTVIETERAVITLEDFQFLTIRRHEGAVESRDFGVVPKNVLIHELSRSMKTGEPFCCDLEMCRPFTKTVNRSFDSSRVIHPIPEEYHKTVEAKQSEQVAVVGMCDIVKDAFERNLLFSEAGVPWAVAGEEFPAATCTFFPDGFGFRQAELCCVDV